MSAKGSAVPIALIADATPLDQETLSSLPLPSLVDALARNEEQIASLVNNEALLDRQVVDDEDLEAGLEKRRSSSTAAAARTELAGELVRRQQLVDELRTRGQAAVIALAEKAINSIDEVGIESPSREALRALEAAMELVEDSQELMMAAEGKPMDADVVYSGQAQYAAMEASVRSAEARLKEVMAAQPGGSEAMLAEKDLQEAVKDLFTSSDLVTEAAITRAAVAAAAPPVAPPAGGPGGAGAGQAAAPPAASQASPSPAPATPAPAPASGAAPAPAPASGPKLPSLPGGGGPKSPVDVVKSNFDINLAFDQLVLKAASLQRLWGEDLPKALAVAGSNLASVGEAALQGVDKTVDLLGMGGP